MAFIESFGYSYSNYRSVGDTIDQIMQYINEYATTHNLMMINHSTICVERYISVTVIFEEKV